MTHDVAEEVKMKFSLKIDTTTTTNTEAILFSYARFENEDLLVEMFFARK